MQFGKFEDNEFLANLLWRNKATITENCDGFEIYTSINKDNIPYITIVKNGVGSPITEINNNQKSCRISLLSPSYIQCDELLTKKKKSGL